jgi:hypothetical protein
MRDHHNCAGPVKARHLTGGKPAVGKRVHGGLREILSVGNRFEVGNTAGT